MPKAAISLVRAWESYYAPNLANECEVLRGRLKEALEVIRKLQK